MILPGRGKGVPSRSGEREIAAGFNAPLILAAPRVPRFPAFNRIGATKNEEDVLRKTRTRRELL